MDKNIKDLSLNIPNIKTPLESLPSSPSSPSSPYPNTIDNNKEHAIFDIPHEENNINLRNSPLLLNRKYSNIAINTNIDYVGSEYLGSECVDSDNNDDNNINLTNQDENSIYTNNGSTVELNDIMMKIPPPRKIGFNDVKAVVRDTFFF